jgi:putative aldouronate transport system substrate-binding protein
VQTFSSFPLYIPPTPLDQNPAWQELNRQLNATLQFSYGDAGKLGAVMAGNDYPDLFVFYGGLTGTAQVPPIPNLPQFLQQSMADLTPYLAGDAVKDYPNLAAIPTFAWKNAGCAVKGHLYMWPVERYRPGYSLMRNAEIYDTEIGPNYLPKNADDFKRVLQQLNKPLDNRFAWGGPGFASELPFFASVFGAPNGWQLDAEGKLTKDLETQQFKEMIGYWRDLVAAGVTHPDAYTKGEPGGLGFIAARTVMASLSFGVGWTTMYDQTRALTPQPNYLLLPPFSAYDGVKPVHFLIGGYIAASAMKKAPPDRIKELLRIVDWLAAPFGSSEDLLMTYGVPDVDFSLDANGRPVATGKSNSDTAGIEWKYIVQRPQVMNSDWPDYAKLAYEFEHAAIPLGIDDPTWGLVSATSSSQGFTLSQAVTDGLRAIVLGQRPLSDFDQIVRDWQTGGGNQIRTEYQQAIAGSTS